MQSFSLLAAMAPPIKMLRMFRVEGLFGCEGLEGVQGVYANCGHRLADPDF